MGVDDEGWGSEEHLGPGVTCTGYQAAHRPTSRSIEAALEADLARVAGVGELCQKLGIKEVCVWVLLHVIVSFTAAAALCVALSCMLFTLLRKVYPPCASAHHFSLTAV